MLMMLEVALKVQKATDNVNNKPQDNQVS